MPITTQSVNDSPYKARITNIGPEEAENFLKGNKYNRKLSQSHVHRLAKAMKEGYWHFTGAPIIRNGDELIDGGHRLRAIIESGLTFPFALIEGVEPDSFRYVDSGKKRNFADVCYIEGYKYYALLAGTIGYLAGFKLTGRFSNAGLEIEDKWNMLQAHLDVQQILPNYARKLFLPHVSAALLATCHYLFAEKDAAGATEFMLQVVDGEQLNADDPAMAYRNYLASLPSDKPIPDKVPKMGNGLIRAWNAYRQNERLTKLRAPIAPPEIL